jgi:F-type H+-transporting ATPase subunit gamma
MAHIREIKKRIKVAQNIQQITRAMGMVAAVRLRRAQERVIAVRPYIERLGATLARLAPAPEPGGPPLLTPRPLVMNVLIVPVTADKGLCGSYNTNIVRRTTATIAALPEAKATLYPLGKKGYDYFRRLNAPMAGFKVDLLRAPSLRQAADAAGELSHLYLSGQFDEVRVIYNRFVSAAHQVVEVDRFLPITLPPVGGTAPCPIIEPNAPAAVDALAQEWIKARMYHYFLEASAGELGARRTAMDAATDNAGEIIATQTLALNRARQTAITMEILDIINGAEAMK